MNRLDRIEKLLEDSAKSQRDTDRRFKDTDARLDARFRETDASFKETDASFKELAQSLKETDRLVKELSKNVGGLNNAIGKIPEAMSLPKIEEDFAKFGIYVSEVHPNVEIRRNGKAVKEVDLLLPGIYNNKRVVTVVETQLQYRSKNEIDKFEDFIQNEFKSIFCEYKDYKIIGTVCALSYGTGLEKYIQDKGIFIMKPKERLVGIVNPKGFKFKTY